MNREQLVIVAAVRSPIGAIGGGLATLQAPDLATHVIKALLQKTGLDPALVGTVCMGWVMQDPRSPNLARNAALRAGIPYQVPATTYHENCASGGAAIHSLARRILLGEVDLGIAGGAESMSNVPRYLYTGRLRQQLYGDMQLVDGLFGALTDSAVGAGELMGLLTERLVERYDVSREEQDEIAWSSHHNACTAWQENAFASAVVPIEVPRRRKDPLIVDRDEGPRAITREELAAAKPYFKKPDGTITTANASSLNDGAAAVMLTTAGRAAELGLKPLAELAAWHNIGVAREYMGEGAFKVIPRLLERGSVSLDEVGYWELNEAFAAVVGAAFRDLPDLPRERTNQWGSGISLGHPVGCTGARQVVDMVHQLRLRGERIGVTTRCVGGGMGSGEVIVSAE